MGPVGQKRSRGDESADKPDSVTRVVRAGDHPSATAVASGLVRPTRGLGRAALERSRRRLRVLLALLRVGFTEPPQSPGVLVVSYTTVSPLPPLPAAVYFLWHCPAGRPGWALPTTLLCGVRTFLSGAGCLAAIAWPTRPRRCYPPGALEFQAERPCPDGNIAIERIARSCSATHTTRVNQRTQMNPMSSDPPDSTAATEPTPTPTRPPPDAT